MLPLGAVLVVAAMAFGCHIPDLNRYDPVSDRLAGMGVSAPVSVVRDQNGVAHITASSEDDLFYAIGYSQAQDRFMMMDLMRRAGSGRLAEILGSPVKYKGVDIPHLDIGLRTFRFAEAARRGAAELDPESRRQLEAFTRGINRFLQDAGDSMPVYQAWKTRPEPWTIEDCFLTAEAMGLVEGVSSFFEEYYLERIRREKGDQARDLFVPQYPEGGVIITNDQPLVAGSPLSFLARRFPSLGSNNWVISGKRTVSGKTIIANDPHVPDSLIPTFWWHVQIKGGRYDVMGMMFPGFPCFGTATNGRLAWALTNVMVDYFDVWREKINPSNPDQYLVGDQWTDFVKEPGVVKVRGKKPVPMSCG